MRPYSDEQYNDAGVSFMEAAERQKKVLGAEHPDTLTSMVNLVSTYRNQGRWKETEELDVQVMETRKRVLGASQHAGHPEQPRLHFGKIANQIVFRLLLGKRRANSGTVAFPKTK